MTREAEKIFQVTVLVSANLNIIFEIHLGRKLVG